MNLDVLTRTELVELGAGRRHRLDLDAARAHVLSLPAEKEERERLRRLAERGDRRPPAVYPGNFSGDSEGEDPRLLGVLLAD